MNTKAEQDDTSEAQAEAPMLHPIVENDQHGTLTLDMGGTPVLVSFRTPDEQARLLPSIERCPILPVEEAATEDTGN